MTKNNIVHFQEMLDRRFHSFWGDNLNMDWDRWLEENNIKKMRYTEDGSGHSEVRRKYGIKVIEHHVCCFNRRASITSSEKHSLLLVPHDFVEKALMLGGLP